MKSNSDNKNEVEKYFNKYGWKFDHYYPIDNYTAYKFKHLYINPSTDKIFIEVFQNKKSDIINVNILKHGWYPDSVLMMTSFSYVQKIDLNDVIMKIAFEKFL